MPTVNGESIDRLAAFLKPVLDRALDDDATVPQEVMRSRSCKSLDEKGCIALLAADARDLYANGIAWKGTTTGPRTTICCRGRVVGSGIGSEIHGAVVVP